MLLIFFVWGLLRFAGDRWWFATLLLFGPRWICGLPLVVLLPVSIFRRSKLTLPLAATATILLFAILDLRIPWRRAWPPSGERIRVFTFNVCADSVPPSVLEDAIRELQPDVVALQECRKSTFAAVFRDWHVCADGQLLIAARFPIHIQRVDSSVYSPHNWPRTTLLECIGEFGGRDVAICTVHLPSPRFGLSRIIDRRTLIAPSRRELLEFETAGRDSVSARVASMIAISPFDRIVMGDFNMPTDSSLYVRDWSSFQNAFTSTGWGFGRTMRAPVGNFVFGIRIDQVLTSGKWIPARSWVGPDLGSDHLPVIADLVWQGGSTASGASTATSIVNKSRPKGVEAVADGQVGADEPQHQSNLRTWTSQSGRTIEARFTGVTGQTVRLQKADDRRVVIEFEQLSEADQEFVRQMQRK